MKIAQGLLFSLFLLGAVSFAQPKTNAQAAEALPPSCKSGDQWLAKGKYNEALQAYHQCLKSAPDHVNGYFNRAGAYTGLKKYTEAIQDYSEVLKRLPLDSEAYFNRGTLYQKLNKPTEALEDFRLAYELKPDTPPFQKALLQSYLTNQQINEALEHLNNAIQRNPQPMLYVQRSQVYQRLGKTTEALNDLTYSLQKDAHSAETWFQRGLLHFKLRQHPKAIYDLTQAIQYNPKMALAYYNRGLADQVKNQCKQAQQDFAKACGLGDKTACKQQCKKP